MLLGLIYFLSESINHGDYLLFSIILFDCNFVIIHGANDVSQGVKITLPLIIHINAKLEILIVTIDDNCTHYINVIKSKQTFLCYILSAD